MKLFAVLLLLLNIAYLAWYQFGAPGQTSTKVETGATPSAIPQFVQADERLMLVSERPAELAPEPPLPQPVAETVVADAEASPGESWCAIAGPFPDSETAAGFLADVIALGGAAEVQSEDFPISSTWWVHLPPFPSQEAASVVLAELQAKNIDSYYIRTGELAGAISLGVFSRSGRATIAQQELSAQGYAPAVREIVRMGTRFNVLVTLANPQIREAESWGDLEANLQSAQLQEIACK